MGGVEAGPPGQRSQSESTVHPIRGRRRGAEGDQQGEPHGGAPALFSGCERGDQQGTRKDLGVIGPSPNFLDASRRNPKHGG